MKVFVSLFILIFPFQLFAQSKFSGHYHDYFGYQIDINPDFSFKYTCDFDLMSSWTTGTWRTNNDTIYFKMVPVYDTIKNAGVGNRDSLVLSMDEKSERIT